MRVILIVTVLILIFAGVALVAKNSSGQSTSAGTTFQDITADLAKGGQLLDVRTPAEYGAGHIDGAINLSLQDMQAGTLPSVTKDRPVYLYCQSGNRSSQATTILNQAGYQNVVNLGAMSHVKSIGGTIVKS